MSKKPFCCRLRADTIKLIKRRAREIRGSQADVIEHLMHGMTVTVTAQTGGTVTTTKTP